MTHVLRIRNLTDDTALQAYMSTFLPSHNGKSHLVQGSKSQAQKHLLEIPLLGSFHFAYPYHRDAYIQPYGRKISLASLIKDSLVQSVHRTSYDLWLLFAARLLRIHEIVLEIRIKHL